jgi:hypothetical protein
MLSRAPWLGQPMQFVSLKREFTTLLSGAAGPSVLLLGGVAHARS